jgi:hypothetical protein
LPHLTNDLDIFLQDDSLGAAPMPAPLPTPRVPLGFPPLAAAGSQTVHLGDPTVPEREDGGQTMSPGGQTTLRTEADSQTTSPGDQTAPHTEAGGPTAKTYAAHSSPASPTLATPCAAPSTPATPRAALASMTPAVPPTALPYPLHYSHLSWAMWEPPAPPLNQ